MKGKGSLLILVLLVCALTVIVGRRYYTYTQSDPDFCSLCHLMQEAQKSWSVSRHNGMVCQACHGMSLLEENRMLVAFVAGNTSGVSQEHGRIRPWKTCVDCHAQETAQGSLTLRNSYGHARHVFMLNLNCNSCHGAEAHDLRANQENCRKCHEDKLVHGMGTAGQFCLNCHSFGDSSSNLVSYERCTNCHKDIPREGVMSRLQCFECHHPHEALRMDDANCLGSCHGDHVQAGIHGKHLKMVELGCTACHKPHTWSVGRDQAPGLCDRCHPLRSPELFVY